MNVRQSDYMEALGFFLDHKAWKEKVTLRDVGEWFVCDIDGEIAGIVSTQQMGKWTRVKSLYVGKQFRRKGVATALVQMVSDGKNCSAFAFNASRPVFELCGFKHERTGKNGVHFMRKTI